MNVQIGDTVLVTETSGFVLPAMVLRTYADLTIDCAAFGSYDKGNNFLNLPFKKNAEGITRAFWDFRPSQKEPESPAQFNISTENKPNLYLDTNPRKVEPEKTQFSNFDESYKQFPPGYLEIKSLGIKLPALLVTPPVDGTFEWALVHLKNGQSVRRSCWYEIGLVVKIYYPFLRFTKDGSIFTPASNHLLATDWTLAERGLT